VLACGALLAQKTSVPDDALYDRVRLKLTSDRDVKGGTLNVEVKDGVVTLSGVLDQEKQRTKAERLARGVTGVKQVVNKITLRSAGK
jgi:hyperosmotically inducible protein